MKTSSVYFSFQSDIKKEQEFVKENRDGKIQDREGKITWRQRAEINEGNLEKSITTENSRTKRVAILMPQVFSVMETRGMGNLKKKAIKYDSYCIAFFL